MATVIAAGCSLGMILPVAGSVYAYVPSKSEMEGLRTEHAQLEALDRRLGPHAARLKLSTCGKQGEAAKFCVLIPAKADTYHVPEYPNAIYVVPVGY
jgi:hypothetical protein